MRDFLTVKMEDSGLAMQDSQGESLLVRVKASHSGTINGNRRFYRPDKMQQAIPTWVDKSAHPRPVLLGHNEDGDVVGRVVEASYVDCSHQYISKYPELGKTIFFADSKKKLPLFESAEWIVDNLVGKEPNYAGLGYTKLGLKITHPDALRKVQDKEYLTVSVGFTTDAAICSVCYQDWADDDRCEHKLGAIVDGRPVFLITGNLFYEECSFVNFPADPHATVMAVEKISNMQDCIVPYLLGFKPNTHPSGLVLTDHMLDGDISIVEGTMPKRVKTVVSEEEKVQLIAEAVKEADIMDCATCGADSVHSGPFAGVGDPNLDWGLTAAETEIFGNEIGLYGELGKEIDINELAENSDSIKDAKLSVKQRKSLPDSAFCGPHRSFPAEDRDHCEAGLSLLGRATELSQGTKDRIKACIEAKMKAKGWESKKADKKAIRRSVIQGYFDKLMDGFTEKPTMTPLTGEELIDALSHIDDAYDACEPNTQQLVRGITSAMLDGWYADNSIEYWMGELTKERDHQLIKKSELQELKDRIASIEAEAALTKAGLEKKLDDAQTLVAVSTKRRKHTLARVATLARVVNNSPGFAGLTTDQIEEKIKTLSSRSVDSLEDLVSDLLDENNSTDGIENAGTVASQEELPVQTATITDAATVEPTLETYSEFMRRTRYLDHSERNFQLASWKLAQTKKALKG